MNYSSLEVFNNFQVEAMATPILQRQLFTYPLPNFCWDHLGLNPYKLGVAMGTWAWLSKRCRSSVFGTATPENIQSWAWILLPYANTAVHQNSWMENEAKKITPPTHITAAIFLLVAALSISVFVLGPEAPTNLTKGGRSLALTARPKGLPYAMWVSHHPFPGIEDLGTWRHNKECNTNHGNMWRSRNSTAHREVDISFRTTKSYLLIYSCIHVTHIIIYTSCTTCVRIK